MITINEAIANLSIQREVKHRLHKTYQADTLALAIQGLKLIQSKRITMSYHPDDLLPGEEKE